MTPFDTGRASVLIIGGDRDASAQLGSALAVQGFRATHAATHRTGLIRAKADLPDAIVLAGEFPGVDSQDVCQMLRRTRSPVSILMLTRPDAVQARIEGLEAGADDCLEVPYDVREVAARLNALIRRRTPTTPSQLAALPVLSFAELELDPNAHAARVDRREIELTRSEYELLELLMINRRCVLASELIYDHVWGPGHEPGNTLRVRIGNLRHKLEIGGGRRLIHTVHGVGYVLREP